MAKTDTAAAADTRVRDKMMFVKGSMPHTFDDGRKMYVGTTKCGNSVWSDDRIPGGSVAGVTMKYKGDEYFKKIAGKQVKMTVQNDGFLVNYILTSKEEILNMLEVEAMGDQLGF